MPIFQVGIDISKKKFTTVVVRLNANDIVDARKKAYKVLQELPYDEREDFLDGIDSYFWDEEEDDFEVEGTSFEEFPIEFYDADLDISKEENLNDYVPENQLKLFKDEV